MKTPVFITARFRTGSTLLWNIFRQLPLVVAYYEPLHEKLPEMIRRQVTPQATHFHVDTYFREYPPAEELARHHAAGFALCRLHLEAQDQHPQLRAYIQYLLDLAGDQVPVLQFNRIDFRLPWVKANFPGVPLIHLYRSPRDQWLSSIADHRQIVEVDKDADPYLITTWARDLCQQFPFLAGDFIRHAYQRHYFFWKLSYLAGKRLADLSISYEEIMEHPRATVRKLLEAANLDAEGNLDRCLSVLVQRPLDAWKQYREEAWFVSMEQECETLLTDLGLNEYFCLKPLSQIVAASPRYRELLADQRARQWSIHNSQVTINKLENICDEKELVISNLHTAAEERLRLIEQLEGTAEERLQIIRQLEARIKTSEAERPSSSLSSVEATSAKHSEMLERLQALVGQNDKLYQRALENAEAVAEARLRVIQVQERALGIHRRWDWREWRRRFFAPRLGVLYQYPPRPLEIPMRYRKIQSLDTPPIISIVSPTFNQGKFVERTIKSVLGQKYPKLEYIIQDGGSSDETCEVLERNKAYLSHYESVKDKGQANAINLGFRHSTGEIMAYLNSDDLLLPGTLNYVAHFFATHPEVDVVYGHRIVIDEYDEEMGRWVMPPHDNAILSWVDYIPQETLFWRRRMWQKVGGYVDESFRFAMDWDLLLRFRDAGATFVRLPRFLGAFRVHPHQKTSAQMEDVGIQEMNRLRELCHGRPVSPYEVARNSRSYLYRHVVYNKLWRLGVLRY